MDAFLVGWWEQCAYAPLKPEKFSFVVQCPSDAIATKLNNLVERNLETLSTAIPAVEIWIEGPGYGVILPLSTAIMLSLDEESLVKNMTATSVLDRAPESTTLAEENLTNQSTGEIVWLDNLARKLNKTNEEMFEIIGIAGFPMFPTPQKRIFLRQRDIPEIVSRWLVTLEDTGEELQTAQPATSNNTRRGPAQSQATVRKTGQRSTKTQASEVPNESTDSPIEYKPKLTSTNIKPDAEETYQIVIPKIQGYPRFVVVKAIAQSTKMGEQILADIEQKFVKKFPNGRVTVFLKNFRQCAINEVNETHAPASSESAGVPVV